MFIEVPFPLNVTIGKDAEFRCKHANADFISWRVNGTSLDRVPLPDVIIATNLTTDGIPIHTLTVTANPQYNGTVVECVALFISVQPFELTPPVTLRIQGTEYCACCTITLSNKSMSIAHF